MNFLVEPDGEVPFPMEHMEEATFFLRTNYRAGIIKRISDNALLYTWIGSEDDYGQLD